MIARSSRDSSQFICALSAQRFQNTSFARDAQADFPHEFDDTRLGDAEHVSDFGSRDGRNAVGLLFAERLKHSAGMRPEQRVKILQIRGQTGLFTRRGGIVACGCRTTAQNCDEIFARLCERLCATVTGACILRGRRSVFCGHWQSSSNSISSQPRRCATSRIPWVKSGPSRSLSSPLRIGSMRRSSR